MGAGGQIALGALFFIGGIVLTATSGGATVYYGAILVGLFMLFRGLADSGSDGDDDEYEEAEAQGTSAQLVAGHIAPEDYPGRPLRDGVEGTVVVGFLVDTGGRVQGAHVVQSSGNDQLDQAACRIMAERFRYEPATDAYGNPVPQNLTQSIAWTLD